MREVDTLIDVEVSQVWVSQFLGVTEARVLEMTEGLRVNREPKYIGYTRKDDTGTVWYDLAAVVILYVNRYEGPHLLAPDQVPATIPSVVSPGWPRRTKEASSNGQV